MGRIREPSKPTGFYFICPFTTRHPQPMAVPLFAGAMRVFGRCPCSANFFTPKGFIVEREALSYQQVVARGCNIPTVTPKFEGASRPVKKKV